MFRYLRSKFKEKVIAKTSSPQFFRMNPMNESREKNANAENANDEKDANENAANENEILLSFVSAPDVETARALIQSALKHRFVACANLLPQIESHYWWQGSIEKAAECLILFKSSQTQLANLRALILKNHPYEVPEFISLLIHSGNQSYINWILNECSTIPPPHDIKNI